MCRYIPVKISTLQMSKADMLAAGIWNFPILEFITSPCSTKSDAICVNTTE